MADVYSSNVFYRRLWDEAGFDPGSFKGIADLHHLPPLTKPQLKEPASLLREKPPARGRMVWHTTSGSSGEPFELVRSWHEERFLTVIRYWMMRNLGTRPTFREARIRVPADFDWLDDWLLRLLNSLGLQRSRIFSCYEPPDSLWRQMAAYAPDVLRGYSETVARVARYGLDKGLRNIRPRFVLVGGEVCTRLMRQQISEAFHAPVYETYATTEVNLIGWSCPQSGLLHICDPSVIVEVLDDEGRPVAEGEPGSLVVTALHLRVMPFVRFMVGDRVVKGPAPCPCGAPFGTLRSIDGREIDRLKLSNGSTLHAYELLNILLEFGLADGWMRQYQLVQDEPGAIEVRIWPLRPPGPGVVEEIATRLEQRTSGTPVRIKLVDKMELDAGGKFHLCRCSI
ncbi:MAG: phenylacetate--CoA ligase family protein [Acidobacteria bacterium]|nr:phenylacetate--CoA ligase family protein [Acidobacteriota bacterium]